MIDEPAEAEGPTWRQVVAASNAEIDRLLATVNRQEARIGALEAVAEAARRLGVAHANDDLYLSGDLYSDDQIDAYNVFIAALGALERAVAALDGLAGQEEKP